MRLAILLFFVVASALGYKINIYNNQPTPLSIQYVYNGAQQTLALAGKTNGVATKWESSLIFETDYAFFSTLNFYATFVPTSPQAPLPTMDVGGGYLPWSPINPNITMKIYPPSFIPNIVCNDVNKKENCYTSNFPNTPVSPATITVPFVTKGQFEIHFNPL